MAKIEINKELPAIKVNQWLTAWTGVKWNKNEHRAEPQHWFYQFSISAGYLKALSGIYARTSARTRGSQDLGIQRRHEEDRSHEIARFVEYGYPWSSLSKAKRESDEFNDLRKPGWLPTAIVVNVLTPRDRRLGKSVGTSDLVEINDGKNGHATVTLPDGFSGRDWRPEQLPPIEVIDGQHRLWAFESKLPDEFELPVVAFKGLDLSWQAYLFYTINIKPKKINASLAFDLYPLLRTEDWLAKFEGHVIYRETRAQELVDLLWSQQSSPWYKRINMLGEPGHKGLSVSQAAWIRSLLATFIRSWEGRGRRLGGLFGAPVGGGRETPSWSRAEQAALLIFMGNALRDSIHASSAAWAKALRQQRTPKGFQPTVDLAFYGPNSLLNQDQGIRAFLHVMNDFLYVNADALELVSWRANGGNQADDAAVSEALKSLQKSASLRRYVNALATSLAKYDWRASDAPGLDAQESLIKGAFRGSGGYRELRRHVLTHLAAERGEIGRAAQEVVEALGD